MPMRGIGYEYISLERPTECSFEPPASTFYKVSLGHTACYKEVKQHRRKYGYVSLERPTKCSFEPPASIFYKVSLGRTARYK